jgi:ketopantoate reductase
MDRVAEYRNIVKNVIQEYAAFDPSTGTVEAETVFDDERGHYELVYTGWENRRRVHGTVIHVDIRDGKIWIQHDGTEDGIADELLAAGVPYDHIVLGFHHPDKRKHTPFAVA